MEEAFISVLSSVRVVCIIFVWGAQEGGKASARLHEV